MHLAFVEVSNFRKLLATRIDLSATTTLFVGANNSGKTSAMLALRRFLSSRRTPFDIHDITLCHWPTIVALGQGWLDAHRAGDAIELSVESWLDVLPALDLWLHVEAGEMHHVRDLIPTLDWEGGLLGVRLRYEPKDLTVLYKDFVNAVSDAERTTSAARANEAHEHVAPSLPQSPPALTLWPKDLLDFLRRNLSTHFTIRAYSLDPSAAAEPLESKARPQRLPSASSPIEGDPVAGLIRIHEIPAQRGFGEDRSGSDEEVAPGAGGGTRLSDQLRSYYAKHLDPTKGPDPTDLEALRAIEAAQKAFDERLTESFRAAFSEVEGLGYPGVTDPRPRVSTRLKATDGLNHSAAISFEVDVVSDEGDTAPIFRLPEAHNGLGYQNLISMIFRLMGFRDAWMRVGKAAKGPTTPTIEPLHLVLVEEPEAHLHPQVQQVFIKKALDVLCAHEDLGEGSKLRTQLVVSTHSSHVAHETPFSCLRYFRRLPAGMVAKVPVATVINLSEVFGSSGDTDAFVTRYLRAHHADLFFADAAILVEGPAERILVPNFIREHFPELNKSYISLLEIGGSHAHRLRPLIEQLGILTLLITDLDAVSDPGGASVLPARTAKQKTSNTTLKSWVPSLAAIDDLLDADVSAKTLGVDYDPLFSVRVAYQTPLEVSLPGSDERESTYPSTFEDALVLENLAFFERLEGAGLVRKFREAIGAGGAPRDVAARLYESLEGGRKAEFALSVLQSDEFLALSVPTYIAEGLGWLNEQLQRKQLETLARDERDPTPEVSAT